MTFSSADAFLDHVAATPSLQAEFTAASSEAEITALLAREGVTCTPADIREAFLERFGSELNEEQLEAIAGGTSGAVIGAAATIGAGVFIGTAIAVGASAAAAA
jgi:predicted ribosomally synthesized peptide with nif11-like leader